MGVCVCVCVNGFFGNCIRLLCIQTAAFLAYIVLLSLYLISYYCTFSVSRVALDDDFLLDLTFTEAPTVTESYLEASHAVSLQFLEFVTAVMIVNLYRANATGGGSVE